jgi:N-methylhydantoinase B/oxoprolinase/acetone carboxylase alpha subunit
VSFSANTRNLAVQSGATFAVYDAETDTQFKYKIDGKMDTKRQAKWMDGHRIVTSVDSKAYVFDFDGTNQNQLQSINPALGTLFDRDYDYAFSVQTNPQNKTASLQWTALTVSN